MLVSTSHRLGDFGVVAKGGIPKPATISDEELIQRWESCPREPWDAWCNCVWGLGPAEEEYRMRCKSKPWACCPLGFCPTWANPWEDYGAGCRNLYKPQMGWAYGVGVATKTVSLTSLFTDPLQAEETKAKEAKEAAAAELARQRQEAQTAKEQKVRRALTTTAITMGASGLAFMALALIAKKRRKVRAV